MNPPRKHPKSDTGFKSPPLFHKDDEAWIWELIKELIARKYFVTRPSKNQLKHRKVNYYPSTDLITVDGEGRHSTSGPQAFLDLLEQMYPKRNRPQSPPQADDTPTPVKEINLEQEPIITAANDNNLPDDEELP